MYMHILKASLRAGYDPERVWGTSWDLCVLKWVWLKHVFALKRSFRFSEPRQSSSKNIVLVKKKKGHRAQEKLINHKALLCPRSAIALQTGCHERNDSPEFIYSKHSGFLKMLCDLRHLILQKQRCQLQRPLAASPTCTHWESLGRGQLQGDGPLEALLEVLLIQVWQWRRWAQERAAPGKLNTQPQWASLKNIPKTN